MRRRTGQPNGILRGVQASHSARGALEVQSLQSELQIWRNQDDLRPLQQPDICGATWIPDEQASLQVPGYPRAARVLPPRNGGARATRVCRGRQGTGCPSSSQPTRDTDQGRDQLPARESAHPGRLQRPAQRGAARCVQILPQVSRESAVGPTIWATYPTANTTADGGL